MASTYGNDAKPVMLSSLGAKVSLTSNMYVSTIREFTLALHSVCLQASGCIF